MTHKRSFDIIGNMETKTAVEALAALAQESRLEIFRHLVRKGQRGSSPGELCEKFEIPPATMSFHLKELTRAGLLISRREGRSIIYQSDFQRMGRLMDFLLENCCSEDGGKCS